MASIIDGLRAELVGATERTPAFALLLPNGWGSQPADVDALRRQARDVLGQIQGVDRDRLGASVQGLLAQVPGGSGECMIAVITQQDVAAEDFAPMSLALAWVRAPSGTTIMALAGQLVRGRAAARMDAAGGILRWVDQVDLPVDDGVVHTVQPTYLIRVPDTEDTALIIRTTILAGAGKQSIGDEGINAMTLLSDSIVATFRWRRDA